MEIAKDDFVISKSKALALQSGPRRRCEIL